MRGELLVLLAGAVALAGAVVVRRRFVAVRVEGGSMSPTYSPGEVVLIRLGHSGLRVGDVVVVERPALESDIPATAGKRWLIKRVAAVGGDPVPPAITGYGAIVPPGTIVVLGDSPVRGYDSRSVGFLPLDRVLGVALRQRPCQGAGAVEPSTRRSTRAGSTSARIGSAARRSRARNERGPR